MAMVVKNNMSALKDDCRLGLTATGGIHCLASISGILDHSLDGSRIRAHHGNDLLTVDHITKAYIYK